MTQLKCASGILMLCLFITACTKDEPVLSESPVTPVVTGISFRQDTIPVTLPLTQSRRERINMLQTLTVLGQYPDSTARPHRFSLRIFGDSARTYRNTEIVLSYTDSLGNSYSSVNTLSDSVVITQLDKTNTGLLKGRFAITVVNPARTKTLVLRQGNFTTRFND